MLFRSTEDMLVYQKALATADAVSAILERPNFQKDFKLHGQLSASSSRVPALIAEGNEQKTDRHFAHYLYIARGSAKESKTHLIVATGKKYLSKSERDPLCDTYDEIARMLSGLIEHLEREDRKHRRPPRETDD